MARWGIHGGEISGDHKCHMCGNRYDAGHFYGDRSRNSGLSSRCKSCQQMWDAHRHKKWQGALPASGLRDRVDAWAHGKIAGGNAEDTGRANEELRLIHHRRHKPRDVETRRVSVSEVLIGAMLVLDERRYHLPRDSHDDLRDARGRRPSSGADPDRVTSVSLRGAILVGCELAGGTIGDAAAALEAVRIDPHPRSRKAAIERIERAVS